MTAADHPMQLVWGLTLWALWFVVAYGGLSVGCEITRPDPATGAKTLINGWLVVVTLITTLLLLWLTRRSWWAWRRTTIGYRRFICAIATCLYAVSAIATLATGFPIIVLPPCI